MTISQGGAQSGPSMTVGGCEASTFTYPIDGPFTVGFGMAADFSGDAMPPLVESTELQLIDGKYRLLIRVSPAGTVTFGALHGPALSRRPGC